MKLLGKLWITQTSPYEVTDYPLMEHFVWFDGQRELSRQMQGSTLSLS